MKTILATVLAGSFTLGLAAAAHAQSAQIPTPANPYPIEAVATDGSPLPSQSSRARFGGASAPFNFVGSVAGAGFDAAGAVVGTGAGVAGGALGYGAR